MVLPLNIQTLTRKSTNQQRRGTYPSLTRPFVFFIHLVIAFDIHVLVFVGRSAVL
jgi:hypothetical protein